MGEYVNSKQVRFDRSHISCGVTEVHHLPDEHPSRTAFAIANNLYHRANPRPGAFITFSDTDDNGRGLKLEKYLREHFPKSGFWTSDKVVNPRTGNVIRMYVWVPNHEEVRAWYTEEAVNRVREEN